MQYTLTPNAYVCHCNQNFPYKQSEKKKILLQKYKIIISKNTKQNI